VPPRQVVVAVRKGYETATEAAKAAARESSRKSLLTHHQRLSKDRIPIEFGDDPAAVVDVGDGCWYEVVVEGGGVRNIQLHEEAWPDAEVYEGIITN